MGREQRTGVFDLRENPTLGELFAANARGVKVTIRTATVGAIAPSQQQPLGYDPVGQLCSVLVQQLTVVVNPEVDIGIGSTVPQLPTLLANVPVSWPRTSQGSLTFPLTIGDTGELIIQDRSLAEWRTKGIPVDPIDMWTHALGDAVFHPGLHTDTDPIVPPTDITATVLDGAALVKIGRNAAPTDFLAKSLPLTTAIDAMLLAGVNAGGPGAANFAAATTAWNLLKALIATTKAQGE